MMGWKKLKAKLNNGHERSVRAYKNILLAIVYKGLGVIIGFAYFPISLEYLGAAKFGIFLTLVSIVDWFAEMDIGIGNGLRNKLGQAIASGDESKAQGYVSTAYFVVGSIFSGISVVAIGMSFIIPWADWLHADPSLNREIVILAVLMFGAFAINFISSMVFQIFYALQRTAIVDLFMLLNKILFLGLIIGLLFYTKESLILYGAAKTITFALVPLAIGMYYFKYDFKKFRPSLRLAKREYFRDLFSLGFQFFIIKISMVIIHQTNNILIARYISPAEVTEYEAAFKYLSIFLLLFVTLTNQYWSASVEAYQKGDLEWMRSTMRQIIWIWVGTIGLSVIMILLAPLFFQLWLQDNIQIAASMTIAVAISINITNWVNMFNLILNGTGKIRLQMYTWVIASTLNVPVSIWLATYCGLGSIGIVLGTVFCLLPLAFLSPMQVYKILNQTDNGIWSK